MPTVNIRPLTHDAFAPFGQVMDMSGASFSMNGGRGERFYDLARIDLAGVHPRAVISLIRSKGVNLPHALKLVERHPLGSQAFHPLSDRPFLVVVAPDEGGVPGAPLAFLTGPGQGVNYAINTWHGPLSPLEDDSDFIVVDRGGDGDNLELHHFATPWTLVA